jgi:sugar phosphate isomerase/epimerase
MSAPDFARPPTVMWGACLSKSDLVTRADCVSLAGFDTMTAFVTDVAHSERTLGSTAALRAELAARQATVSCLDVYLGWYPGHDPAAAEGAASEMLKATEHDVLRYAAELEVEFISLAAPFWGQDAPFESVVDSLGRFTDKANAVGARPQLEISNGSKVSTVQVGLKLVDAVGRDGLGLLIDTFNLIRSGGRPQDVDDIPRDRIFQVQLADGAQQPVKDRFYDSLHCRQLPGRGDLPVLDIVQRIADKGPLPPIGPEIFNDELAAMSPQDAALACAEATSSLLSHLVRTP